MRTLLSLLLIFLLGSVFVGCTTPPSPHAEKSFAYDLIKRIVPEYADQFSVEHLPSDSSDWFEIESVNNQIVLRGNNGVTIASALYYYLKEYGHCQITWNGTNLDLPEVLPIVHEKIRKDSPYEYRYDLNYCTFNYSMSWWDWERWEKD